MQNFTFDLSTKILFGAGRIEELGKEIKGYSSKVLLAYGGGSIKRNGIYDKAIASLKAEGIHFWELDGIQPNPRISRVREGVRICRENNIGFVLAIGAGSTIDCCKAIAAGRFYNGDPWDFLIRKASIRKTLPIGTVLTLAATGSEMNGRMVISNDETEQKLSTGSVSLIPRFSILDPEFTYSVPANQTAAGVADIMSHVFEQYFSRPDSAFFQDRLSEAVLKTCLKYGPIALAKPDDYEARANLMWAGSIALNGLLGAGKEQDWATHLIEHELSAFYDITHGIGLAILTPHYMRYIINEHSEPRLADYGRNIWGLTGCNSEIAIRAVEMTEGFFKKELRLPSSLKEVGIGDEKFEVIAKRLTMNRRIGNFRPLGEADIINILRLATPV